MSSLNLFVSPIVTPRRRSLVRTSATAAKSSPGGSEEKSFFDFILGKITKQDQFYETDPILKKVEDKSSTGTTTRGKTVAVPPPAKKKGNGGFDLGGLFAKK